MNLHHKNANHLRFCIFAKNKNQTIKFMKKIKNTLILSMLSVSIFAQDTLQHFSLDIVTPITDGKLLLIDKCGNESNYNLISCQSYFRKADVEHNVINSGKQKLIFIEIELKKLKKG